MSGSDAAPAALSSEWPARENPRVNKTKTSGYLIDASVPPNRGARKSSDLSGTKTAAPIIPNLRSRFSQLCQTKIRFVSRPLHHQRARFG